MLPFVRMFDYGNEAPSLPKIKKLSTGYQHAMLLTQTGDLYAKGSNASGQLGTGNTTAAKTWILVNSSVADVYCSANGTLIKKNDESWWSSGSGAAAGVNSVVNTWSNVSVQINSMLTSLPGSFIKQFVSSFYSSMAVRSDDTVWVIGQNNNGEITGTTAKYNTFVNITTNLPSVPVKIYGSENCMAYTDSTGAFYYSGQMVGGIAGGSANATTFTRYNVGLSTNKIIDFNTTGYGSFFIIETTAGVKQSYAGGYQRYGQLGDGGSTATILAPAPITTPNSNLIKLFKGTSMYNQHLITKSGIYATGQNSISQYNGTLGIGSTIDATTYTLAQISLSSYDNIEIHTTLDRTFLWAGDYVYSTGLNSTYSSITSNSYVLDMPSI